MEEIEPNFHELYQQMIDIDILLCIVVIKNFEDNQSQQIIQFVNDNVMKIVTKNEMKVIIMTENDERLIYYRLKNGNIPINSIEIYSRDKGLFLSLYDINQQQLFIYNLYNEIEKKRQSSNNNQNDEYPLYEDIEMNQQNINTYSQLSPNQQQNQNKINPMKHLPRGHEEKMKQMNYRKQMYQQQQKRIEERRKEERERDEREMKEEQKERQEAKRAQLNAEREAEEMRRIKRSQNEIREQKQRMFDLQKQQKEQELRNKLTGNEIVVKVRLFTGKTIQNTFYLNNTMCDVYNWVRYNGFQQQNFSLTTPNKVQYRESEITLEQLGMKVGILLVMTK